MLHCIKHFEDGESRIVGSKKGESYCTVLKTCCTYMVDDILDLKYR